LEGTQVVTLLRGRPLELQVLGFTGVAGLAWAMAWPFPNTVSRDGGAAGCQCLSQMPSGCSLKTPGAL